MYLQQMPQITYVLHARITCVLEVSLMARVYHVTFASNSLLTLELARASMALLCWLSIHLTLSSPAHLRWN